MQFFYLWAFLQIVLESLPVSSSGNVYLWISTFHSVLNFNFLPAINTLEFDFLLHGPTILIVTLYFLESWVSALRGYLKGAGGAASLLLYCAWADFLTAVWYAVFKAVGKSWFPLSVGFFVTSVALLSLQWLPKKVACENETLSLYHATLLGMFQGIALLPGLSRFGITYVVARHAQYSSESAFRYSFLLQMPLIGAAFLKGCYSFYYFEYKAQLLHPLFGLTILTSTILSYFALVWVGMLVRKNQVYLFGWYVIGLAGLAVMIGK